MLAVDQVNLRVQAGELLGLIGHNGAGKSTLLRMILGLIAPSAGEIRVLGESVNGAAFRDVRRRIGYLPENVVFYDNLSGTETLRFFARLKGVPEAGCADLLERVGLTHAANRRVGTYSKGMRQRLGFAQALLGSPALLILDEPTTGLDPEAIKDFYLLLENLRREGVTVILSSHILSEIQERVSRLVIMRAGRMMAEGTVQSLREEMDLPLRIELVLAPAADAGALHASLAAAGVARAELLHGHLHLSCPRQAKMATLNLIAGLGDTVLDLHVHEPSLEDVYMGYLA
jgi:Cu-processing system ATP-binding protein